MKYCQVMKNGKVFTALRAAGLALELAFHVGICLGFFSVTAEDLLQVEAKGDDVQNKPG